MGITFDASDFARLSAALSDRAKGTSQQAATLVRATAKGIEASAKSSAPVRTGNLKNSIKTSDLRATTGANPEAVVSAGAEYAAYVELGTSRMAPQPYMGPAAEKHAPAFISGIEKLIGG